VVFAMDSTCKICIANKRSITLKSEAPAGLAIFTKGWWDGRRGGGEFPPGRKDRLGSPMRPEGDHPRIILASISGFGQTGPYRTRAGFDQIAQGMGGLMWVTGLPEQAPCAPASRSRILRPVSLPYRNLVPVRNVERSGEGNGSLVAAAGARSP